MQNFPDWNRFTPQFVEERMPELLAAADKAVFNKPGCRAGNVLLLTGKHVINGIFRQTGAVGYGLIGNFTHIF